MSHSPGHMREPTPPRRLVRPLSAGAAPTAGVRHDTGSGRVRQLCPYPAAPARKCPPPGRSGGALRGGHPDRRARWGWHVRFRQRLDQPQLRAAAQGHPEDTGYPRACPTSQGEADHRQCRAQPLGPPTVPPGQSQHLLNERPPRARRSRAAPPGALQWAHAPGTAGGAMNPARPAPANRTRRTARRTAGLDSSVSLFTSADTTHVRDRRDEQLLQPDDSLFHGPELSTAACGLLRIRRQLMRSGTGTWHMARGEVTWPLVLDAPAPWPTAATPPTVLRLTELRAACAAPSSVR